jgi:arginyl-tRNA synthetase
LYRHLRDRIAAAVVPFVLRTYNIGIQGFAVEEPPKIEFGEYAFPLAFELARKLRKPPRKIAEEIVAGIGPIEGFERLEVAGAGYINAHVDRAEFAAALVRDALPKPKISQPEAPDGRGKILVEHTSINPNKAAHIGHLRNAILGDTFVRLLREADRKVDVQNYIDNTGVQVADVVVGFTHIEKKSRDEIEALAHLPRFDYYCWDLYARVSQWYEQDKQNLQARAQTLHGIEDAASETAAIAELISTAVLRRHLETMDRLEIEYDFLPRESEILHLHFWDAAFAKLKDAGVLTYENAGKNKGCWVMRRAGTVSTEDGGDPKEAEPISEEDQKVIVRSNGTVGYVGKDIAYHMWKFGLLGRDFGYRKFYRYPDQHDCWISSTQGEKDHPHFGGVAEIYNVIDARQSEAQNTVIEALRGLGHNEAADHYTHFSYEMVALTPRCAAELGYTLRDEDKTRSYIEVSGRRGFGVKADDLLEQLIASAKSEVDSRHPQLTDAERRSIATQIAIGALRYFMLKFTKQSVIAFDFKEALSFEGETGPYAQYAVVRATSIFKKAAIDADTFSRDLASAVSAETLAKFLAGDNANEFWELWLVSAKTSYLVDQSIATTEPAYLAKHAFRLAQLFNTFYHRHPILSEPDERRKQFLLATVAVVRRELIRTLAVMGITVPPVM